MFSYIKGILIAAHPSFVILEANGIGYHVFIPCRVLGELPLLGNPVQLHTTFVIREFSQTLYGFLNSGERDLFEVMLNITGIGPKLALSLIGHLTLQELQRAVSCQDLPTLCHVPGVGKKTAERLVVELKDKLSHLVPDTLNELTIHMTQDPKAMIIQDAMLALINLGYNQHTAQKALKQTLKDLPETANLALLITTALRHI